MVLDPSLGARGPGHAASRPLRKPPTRLIVGYLAAWLGFGILAHLLDLAVHDVAGRVDWFVWNGWAIGAGVAALAGLFQFSRLKDFCLERCRAPLGFILRHWHGPGPRRAALAVGVNHGIYCVGCCWALMLLMFVTGTASLGWMLLLALMMAAEKNLPGGHHLSRAIGAGLLAVAAAMVMPNVL